MLSRYERFSTAISAIYHSIQKIERDEMVKSGGKGAFAQYLVALSRYPEGLTAAQLGELCDRDKAAVSRAVAEMEDRGLIVRESGKARIYKVALRLTEAGRSAAQFVCERAEAAVESGGQGLAEEERAVLYAALDRIAANLEIISKEGIP